MSESGMGPSGTGTVPAHGRMRTRSFIEELILQAVAVGGLILSMRLAMKYLDPYKEQREASKKRAALLSQMLGRHLVLNEFEQLLAANVVNPVSIDVNLSDVSGLDDLIQELELKVIMPMMQPNLYCTTLWKPTRGVLLYGPPGTGKTMLAKALAKHSGCFFLNITASSIMSKWLGDSNRLARAIFTLAEKLQPCIIFIDEVDAMLGKRGGQSEHEAGLQMKTEFMQLWDGIESSKGLRVVVMGATNRPAMVDEAVLRRFSIQHEVGLPNETQRAAILSSYLKRHVAELGPQAVDPELLASASGSSSGGALTWLATSTPGFSGSDLMELCSQAAQCVLGEHWAAQRLAARNEPAPTARPSPARGSAAAPAATPALQLRALTLTDFKTVLKRTLPATQQADDYTRRTPSARGMSDPTALMQLLASLGGQGPPPAKK
mmetsp:Transcript_2185/g.3592  ORF Transcript_2185/g.3592 Transcript_2185/m.3592 type:complete len:435 (-) Transcript_2185:462-1766(-)